MLLKKQTKMELKLLINFFKKMNLKIIDAQRNDLQGGSLVCYAQHVDGPYTESDRLKKLIELEEVSELDKKETFNKFSDELINLKKNK